MSDLISRKEMLRIYQDVCIAISCRECPFNEGDCLLEKWIHSLPSAEPDKDLIHLQKEQAYMQGYEDGKKSRNKGKWIVISEFEDCRYVKCNQCKVTQVFYYNKPLTNFCPECGADMRGKEK